jgi:cytochrome P450
MKPHRVIFDFLEDTYIGKQEKTLLKNIESFRVFIQGFIEQRRIDMKTPNVKLPSDFLSILLEDEVYYESDKMIVDECFTFVFESTQTTTTLMSNFIFSIIMNEEC